MTDKDDFIKDNLGLVHSCAKKFIGRGIEYEDLFQSGCMGLMKAVDKFDPSRELKFSTYAVPLIIGEIKGLFRYGGPIKVSRGLKSLAMKIAFETEKYAEKYGASPTLSQLSEILGESKEKIAEAIGSTYAPQSLTGDDDNPAPEIPVDGGQDKLTEFLSLWQTIEALPEEDKKLIALRYYMNKTQQETAGLLGSSQVQVSRREKKILLYMRGVLW